MGAHCVAVISAMVVEWVVIVVEFILNLFLVIAAILVSLTLEWPLLHKSVCCCAVKFAEAHSVRFRCNVVEWLLGGERVEIFL